MLETLGLDVGITNVKYTPAKVKPLAKHVWKPTSGDFNYSSVIGLLLYLASHTYPDILYNIKSAIRCMFWPKLVHKHALKQSGWYLKATGDKGMIMKPCQTLLNIYGFLVSLECMDMKQ